MTERLYYTNPELLEFEASIVSTTEKDGRYLTLLDKSAFYPTSGGQEYDLGKINDIDVLDVFEENDEVYHVSGRPLGKVGDIVQGQIDKERRFWHRQIHSAQHILSQSFAQLYDLETKSVHLGAEYGNIEVESADVTEEQLEAVENLSNQLIQENHPVDILFIDDSDVSKYPFRKIPDRKGKIRVIKIGEIEYSACGGTHVNTTAEVQLIKIISTEKIRGRTAVNFLCGTKAIADYKTRYKIVADVSQYLTCNILDIQPKVEKLESELKEQSREITKLQKELLPVKSSHIAKTKLERKGVNVVISKIEDFNPKLLGNLSLMLSEEISGLAVLTFENRIAVASELDNVNASELAKFLSAELGYKGGGSPKAAQLGASETVDVELLTEKVYKYIDEL